jgi:hypothetical protein
MSNKTSQEGCRCANLAELRCKRRCPYNKSTKFRVGPRVLLHRSRTDHRTDLFSAGRAFSYSSLFFTNTSSSSTARSISTSACWNTVSWSASTVSATDSGSPCSQSSKSSSSFRFGLARSPPCSRLRMRRDDVHRELP